ncbi:MAG: hypothetical protein QXN26_04745 [Thermoplasmataceae archaeon]
MKDTESEIKNWEQKVYSSAPDATDKQKISIIVLIGVMYAVMIFLVYLLAIHAIAVAPV